MDQLGAGRTPKLIAIAVESPNRKIPLCSVAHTRAAGIIKAQITSDLSCIVQFPKWGGLHGFLPATIQYRSHSPPITLPSSELTASDATPESEFVRPNSTPNPLTVFAIQCILSAFTVLDGVRQYVWLDPHCFFLFFFGWGGGLILVQYMMIMLTSTPPTKAMHAWYSPPPPKGDREPANCMLEPGGVYGRRYRRARRPGHRARAMAVAEGAVSLCLAWWSVLV